MANTVIGVYRKSVLKLDHPPASHARWAPELRMPIAWSSSKSNTVTRLLGQTTGSTQLNRMRLACAGLAM